MSATRYFQITLCTLKIPHSICFVGACAQVARHRRFTDGRRAAPVDYLLNISAQTEAAPRLKYPTRH